MTTTVTAHVGLGIHIDCWFLDEDDAETPSPVFAAPSVPTPSPDHAAVIRSSIATVGLGIDIPGWDMTECCAV
ncbi:uncharacterized protein PHACADRAFT_252496 [Phanerochaete carnosa HHB-10118-sp]|uniref:Uncharacterized protein n=1 Tax=Phanerochaete carnosa (strain HHB-10118-sp) TaxID=650164 RepID=K5WG69_PHACS|nr:uncharacterized protein PHACADRAFT_252496 [Phanerochaete carnosa HHB-10118-sp]EKM58285.1 hypothetical protein PHACADRAFT_252496 [Phanerochaete carnosa HHB-10118-sp]